MLEQGTDPLKSMTIYSGLVQLGLGRFIFHFTLLCIKIYFVDNAGEYLCMSRSLFLPEAKENTSEGLIHLIHQQGGVETVCRQGIHQWTAFSILRRWRCTQEMLMRDEKGVTTPWLWLTQSQPRQISNLPAHSSISSTAGSASFCSEFWLSWM